MLVSLLNLLALCFLNGTDKNTSSCDVELEKTSEY